MNSYQIYFQFCLLFSLFIIIFLFSFLPSFAISQKQTLFGIQKIDWVCDNPILKLFSCSSKDGGSGNGNPNNNNSTKQQLQSQSENIPNSNKSPTQLSPNQIYNNVKDSVVTVRAEVNGPEGPGTSSGSGFIWDSSGHIVTDRHVIEGSMNIIVQYNGDTNNYPAHVIGSDAYSDLAVLQVDNAPSFNAHPVQLRTTDNLQVGETVYAIGNPLGSYTNTFTQGMVNKLDVINIMGNENNYDPSNGAVGDIKGYAFVHMIQFDAGATHGDSGGPLLDKDGKVIGIIDAIEPNAEFIHFATPLVVLKTIVPNLITHGVYKHPWIGMKGVNGQNGGCKTVQTDPKSPLPKINGMNDRTNILVHTKASSRHGFFNSFPHGFFNSFPHGFVNSFPYTINSIQFDTTSNGLFKSSIPINSCSNLFDAIENHQYSIGGTTGESISLYLYPPNTGITNRPVLINSGERWLK